MSEYIGDETLGEAIADTVSDAKALEFLINDLALGLAGNSDSRLAQEYASWHSEELLENAAKKADQLAKRLHSIKRYTRIGVTR